jgi:hypothetical protein
MSTLRASRASRLCALVLLLQPVAGCGPEPAPVSPTGPVSESSPAPVTREVTCAALAPHLRYLEGEHYALTRALRGEWAGADLSRLGAYLRKKAKELEAPGTGDAGLVALRESLAKLELSLALHVRALSSTAGDETVRGALLRDLERGGAILEAGAKRCDVKVYTQEAPGAWTSDATNGHLPAGVIQLVVRANFDHFRRCYEDGLQRNPNLRGGVTFRFVIDHEGRVIEVGEKDRPSDSPYTASDRISDPQVVTCLMGAFKEKLSFPRPQNYRNVTVTYPITFSPGS